MRRRGDWRERVKAGLSATEHAIIGSVEQIRHSGCRWPVLARAATPVTLVAVLSTLVVLVLIPLGTAVGIPQRVSVLCISLWLALRAWDLAEGRRLR